MRLPVLFAAAALLSTALAAHADTITENVSISNVVANEVIGGFYVANTNIFAQFNPSSGTLNSVTLSLNGTATATSNNGDVFLYVTPPSSSIPLNFSGNGLSLVAGSFSFSASGQDSSFDIAFFEGTGTKALQLDFFDPTTVNSGSGTLTYNYTPTAAPPAAVTPEPSSIALLGTGLLGIAGTLKRRLA